MNPSKQPKPAEPGPEAAPARPHYDPSLLMKRHLRFGWWSLLVFLTVGLGLEALHGFKVPFYLDVSNETRRLMWTLGHAHGTLLGLVNLGFALTVRLLPEWSPRESTAASLCLCGATWLLPAGFFLGGLSAHAGDPGLGILLVPCGGLSLLMAVFLTACGVGTVRAAPARDLNRRGTNFKGR